MGSFLSLTESGRYDKIPFKRNDRESKSVDFFREPCNVVGKGKGNSTENGSGMVYRSLFIGLGYNRFACYSETVLS